MSSAATMVMRMMLRRLRAVDPDVLCELKTAMREWNSKTKEWNSIKVHLVTNARDEAARVVEQLKNARHE